jgi:hypothetical protein
MTAAGVAIYQGMELQNKGHFKAILNHQDILNSIG